MPWLRTSDDCLDSHEADLAGEDAMNLWWRGRVYSAKSLTNGNVCRNALHKLTGKPNPEELAATLVKFGFWVVTEEGWLDPGYLEDNPPAGVVLAKRKAAKDRKDRWLAKKNGGEGPAEPRVPERVPSGVPERVENAPPVPVPVPLKGRNNDDDLRVREKRRFPTETAELRTGASGKPVKGSISSAPPQGKRLVGEQSDAGAELATGPPVAREAPS